MRSINLLTLSCNIHYIRAKKRDYIVIVGVEEQKIPRIIFADVRRGRNLLDAQTGTLHVSQKEIVLVCDNGIEIRELSTNFNGVAGLVCKLISLLLEQNTPISSILPILRKSHAQVGLEAALIRVLKYYQSLMQRSDEDKKCHCILDHIGDPYEIRSYL